jgi:hypothetical protein
MTRHVQYKDNGGRKDIDRETPMCGSCEAAILDGVAISDLTKRSGRTIKRLEELPPSQDRVVKAGKPKRLQSDMAEPACLTSGTRSPIRMMNGKDDKKEARKPLVAVCDVCGQDATGGQSTTDGVLCPAHVKGQDDKPARRSKKV